MIQGIPTNLSPADQLLVGKWAVKTAMVLEAALTNGPHFQLDETRLMIDDEGIPPYQLRVFSAAVEGEIPPLGFYYMAASTPAGSDSLLSAHFYTIQMGTLVLQVCRPEPPLPNYNVWTDTPLVLPREISLIPTLDSHEWPPVESMSLQDLIEYSRRGIPVPEDWRVGPYDVVTLLEDL